MNNPSWSSFAGASHGIRPWVAESGDLVSQIGKETCGSLAFEGASAPVSGGQPQDWYKRCVTDFDQWFLFQLLLHEFAGFFFIQSQQPLVEAASRPHHGFIAKQNREKCQLRNVFTDHNHTHCERRRQQQADRSPQPSPEDRGQQDSQRRQAGAGSVEPGFNKIIANDFQQDEEASHEQRL